MMRYSVISPVLAMIALTHSTSVGDEVPTKVPPPKPNQVDSTRIVFVCDGSGSMAEKMPFLRNEVLNAISTLKPVQEYTVLFFQADAERGVLMASPKAMKATPQNREKTAEFVRKLAVQGASNPLPAIEAALKLDPTRIYLTSDGHFDGPVTHEAVIAGIAKMNREKQVRINTIFLKSPRDTAEESTKAQVTMAQIAKDAGGTLNIVDLGATSTKPAATTPAATLPATTKPSGE